MEREIRINDIHFTKYDPNRLTSISYYIDFRSSNFPPFAHDKAFDGPLLVMPRKGRGISF
jgi:hypothetical protein